MVSKVLRKLQMMELSKLQKTQDVPNLHQTHAVFSGSPVRHPSDENKIILVADLGSDITHYYEFELKDVAFAEEVKNTVTEQGRTIVLAKLWIRKQSVGVKCFPFLVEEND